MPALLLSILVTLMMMVAPSPLAEPLITPRSLNKVIAAPAKETSPSISQLTTLMMKKSPTNGTITFAWNKRVHLTRPLIGDRLVLALLENPEQPLALILRMEKPLLN